MARKPRRWTPPAAPDPVQIRAARLATGLTQAQAADLVHVTLRSWQRWESGERAMLPAVFELFIIKTQGLPQ